MGRKHTLGRDSSVLVSKRVVLRMRVQECLGVLVAELDRVVVVDANTAQRQSVVRQGLLEAGGHEVIAGPALVQDREVDVKPE